MFFSMRTKNPERKTSFVFFDNVSPKQFIEQLLHPAKGHTYGGLYTQKNITKGILIPFRCFSLHFFYLMTLFVYSNPKQIFVSNNSYTGQRTGVLYLEISMRTKKS